MLTRLLPLVILLAFASLIPMRLIDPLHSAEGATGLEGTWEWTDMTTSGAGTVGTGLATIFPFTSAGTPQQPFAWSWADVNGTGWGMTGDQPSIQGDQISFSASRNDRALSASWNGTVAADAQSISGTWTQSDSQFGTFVATKVSGAIHLFSDDSWKFSRSGATGWEQSGFDDSAWGTTVGNTAGLCGTAQGGMWAPNPVNGEAIFVRRTVTLGAAPSAAMLAVLFDDDGYLYINGVLAHSNNDGFASGFRSVDITSFLHAGSNVIAVQATDTAGGCQGIWLAASIVPVSSPTPTATPSCPPQISGQWSGTWTSTAFPPGGGTWSANLTMSSSSISGTITISGSVNTVDEPLTGAISCSDITFGTVGATVTFTGILTADGTAASGTYSALTGDYGTWDGSTTPPATPTPTPAPNLTLLGFTSSQLDLTAGSCHETILTFRNDTGAPISYTATLKETANFFGFAFNFVSDIPNELVDCASKPGYSGDCLPSHFSGDLVQQAFSIDAGQTKQVCFSISHTWQWIPPLDEIGGAGKLALFFAGFLGLPSWFDLIRGVGEGTISIADAATLVANAADFAPHAKFVYTLQLSGLSVVPGVATARAVNLDVLGWKQEKLNQSVRAAIYASLACPISADPDVYIKAFFTGMCGGLTAFDIGFYKAAYDPQPDYTELVQPQPLPDDALQTLPPGDPQSFASHLLVATSYNNAGVESLVRSAAATEAGDSFWEEQQLSHALDLFEQAYVEYQSAQTYFQVPASSAIGASSFDDQFTSILSNFGMTSNEIADFINYLSSLPVLDPAIGTTISRGFGDIQVDGITSLGGSAPTATDTPTATPTPTDTPTDTPTPTATNTPSPTATFTNTATATSSPTRSPTSTATPTPSATRIPQPLCADVTGDHRVDLRDVLLIALHIGQRYDRRYDLNGDGRVDLGDLFIALQQLGRRC